MTGKERFIHALERKPVDRLPVTTHHVMPSFLEKFLQGKTDQDFFDRFGLDPIRWIIAYTADTNSGEYFDPGHSEPGFLEARRVSSDNWRFKTEEIPGRDYATRHFSIITPEKTLSMILQSDAHTTWVAEHLIKERNDIEVISKYMTHPKCDVTAVNEAAEAFGERGLVRGHIA